MVSVVVVVAVSVVVVSVVTEDGESSALEQESIRLKANAKIVAKRRYYSFIIVPIFVRCELVVYLNWGSIPHYFVQNPCLICFS